MDSADPLDGWSMQDVLRSVPFAKNDVYGGMFNHVQDTLFEFCQKIQKLKVCFQLFHMNALELPRTLKQTGMDQSSFDRIEVRQVLRTKINRPPSSLIFFLLTSRRFQILVTVAILDHSASSLLMAHCSNAGLRILTRLSWRRS